MLTATNTWSPYIIAVAITISALSIFIWNRRKKYQKTGKIIKLFFYPVKSLKAVEVTKGNCTKFGFEVNGLLDRSFMIVNKDGILISQRESPSLVLLTPHISGNHLIISKPGKEDALKVEIKESPSPDDKRINCRVHADAVEGCIDCGDEAASWFESYLNIEGVRLVRFFPTECIRTYTRSQPFYVKLRAEHPASFQDLAAFHIISQSSINDLNTRIGHKKVTVHNFRPNILIDGCEPFAEDSWKYIKFNSKAELLHLMPTTRCLMTTNDPETGILSQKEPLVTLRKYRIMAPGQKLSKVTGSVPCLGVVCAVLSPGEIEVGNDVFAVVGEMPKMKEQST